MFQCYAFVQICLLLAPPSFWNRNDTKLPKPWKMSLILSNLHYTWTKRATFLWQTFIVRATNITFSLVQSIQLSGKLSRLKSKPARKNVHASRLNANGSILRCINILRLFSKLAALKPQITILWLPNYSAIAVILILRTSNVFFFTWLFPLVYGKTH